MKLFSRRWPGTKVSTRLALLVLVPVVAVCLLAGSVVHEHRTASSSAGEVERGVVVLSHLVALRDALQVQHTATSIEVRAADLGTTVEEVSSYLGFEVTGETEVARQRAEQAVGALGDRSPVDRLALRELYRAIEVGSMDGAVTAERLSELLDDSDGSIARELDRLTSLLLAARLDERSALRSLESLRVTTSLTRVAARQGVELSAVWFPTPGEAPAEGPVPLAVLAQDTANYDAAINRLLESAQPAVLIGIDELSTDEAVRSFEVAVDETLAGRPYVAKSRAVDPWIVEAFAGYIARSALLSNVELVAAEDVRAEARTLAASEFGALIAWCAAFLAIGLATLVLCWFTARSISRPLRGLAHYVQAVNHGDLDIDPPRASERGPQETRVASALFHDVVVNLRLLESKATALAGCRFGDPVLDVPFPGRLGTSFERSVAVLAGSIVDRDALQSELVHQSNHDALTGIRNRAAALSGLDSAIARSARQGSALAVLFLDLNEFKSVNDRFGHTTGDTVLCEVAARIERCLRTVDFVARIGGDEFVIVAEDIAGIEGASTLARRVVEAIDRPLSVGTNAVHVGVAVGIALRQTDVVDPLILLSQADAAMYRAKRYERSGIEIFDATMRAEASERTDIEHALTSALRATGGGGLCLHYQPVLATATGALAGVEALIRWDRPGRGLVTPDSFIPIAEGSDLIIDVDCWVLDQAARQLVAWSIAPGLAGVPIAVNISGRHLLSGLLSVHLQRVIRCYAIDPALLSVEITETVLLTDLGLAGEQLDAVHALGVRVAIDDFGTGYTSPAHLQFLPMDTIKVERSFVSRIQEPRGRSLVRMIIELGHAIDVAIVAEGVETADELEALEDLGADYVQGYLLGRPIPADQMVAFAGVIQASCAPSDAGPVGVAS